VKALAVLSVTIFVAFAALAQNVTPINDFASSRAKVVKIDNVQSWTATGISIAASDTVVMIVRGLAAPNGLTVPSTVFWVGPEGFGGATHPENPVPAAADYSVVGRIGTSGTPFYVGSSCHLKAITSGQLYLGTNDANASDNAGYYIAHIYFNNKR
jgi:hypothetical protein